MFRDEAQIEVIAGKGGDGRVSFRTEKYVPHGGPDGGDGGRGGDIVFVASSRESSLLSVARSPRYRVKDGRPGGTCRCTGESGSSVRIELPIGTLVYDRKRGNRLADLVEEGQELVVAVGGKPGKGNCHFASSVRQEPRVATKGREGERRELESHDPPTRRAPCSSRSAPAAVDAAPSRVRDQATTSAADGASRFATARCSTSPAA